jgi:hypothetical protein
MTWAPRASSGSVGQVSSVQVSGLAVDADKLFVEDEPAGRLLSLAARHADATHAHPAHTQVVT